MHCSHVSTPGCPGSQEVSISSRLALGCWQNSRKGRRCPVSQPSRKERTPRDRSAKPMCSWLEAKLSSTSRKRTSMEEMNRSRSLKHGRGSSDGSSHGAIEIDIDCGIVGHGTARRLYTSRTLWAKKACCVNDDKRRKHKAERPYSFESCTNGTWCQYNQDVLIAWRQRFGLFAMDNTKSRVLHRAMFIGRRLGVGRRKFLGETWRRDPITFEDVRRREFRCEGSGDGKHVGAILGIVIPSLYNVWLGAVISGQSCCSWEKINTSMEQRILMIT
jgi:hypothetical protein